MIKMNTVWIFRRYKTFESLWFSINVDNVARRIVMKIIVLDTETTGMLEKDRICQLSYLVLNEEFEIEEIHNDLCTPPLPISYEAMAIHHITPEMLEGEPTCVQTKAYKRLCELNVPTNILSFKTPRLTLECLLKRVSPHRWISSTHSAFYEPTTHWMALLAYSLNATNGDFIKKKRLKQKTWHRHQSTRCPRRRHRSQTPLWKAVRRTLHAKDDTPLFRAYHLKPHSLR